MSNRYFCANCNEEFTAEQGGKRPRCPKCMRRSGIDVVKGVAVERWGTRRLVVATVLVVAAAGLGYAAYRSTVVTLEKEPPLRPLEPRELSAYLERDGVEVGPYESMFVLPERPEGWPEAPAEIADRMHDESSRWSLEHPLPRESLTAEETLARMAAQKERVKFYPHEMAVAMTALLRARGSKAMVAEAWELEGARAPADPSGVLGYFVTAIYEGGAEQPSAYFDPWGGRGEVTPSGVRVLRDPEVVAAAVATEATRIFARSGDGKKALPMTEAALSLDPKSPSIRVAHATVLTESGGMADGIRELQSAIELRSDGPSRLSLAQLYLAQAGMLEMTGQQEAADAQFAEANRIVTQLVEQWPGYGRAHLALASVYLGLDDPARARIELETAQSLSPDAPMVWAGWAQYHLAQEDPVSASASMKRAVELDPDNWQLLLQAATVFQRAGDEELARASVAQALELVPVEKRSRVRQYVERMMGPGVLGEAAPEPPTDQSDTRLDLPEPVVSAPPAGADGSEGPALMLGDPSHLKLRDPDQQLKLDLEE